MITTFEQNFKEIQSMIIDHYSSFETTKSCTISDDNWTRSQGGGGRTYIIENGKFFDKAAVNFSSISGTKLPHSARDNIKNKKAISYRAMGVSVITHPKNPFIPTSHMNIRLFLLLNKKKEIVEWWVGGGYDLTPFFPYAKDCLMWHKDAKAQFDKFNKKYYKEFAKNCDDYFFLPHRKEKRGIGGVFFDNFNELDLDLSMQMLKNTAKTYLNSYLKIINLRKGRQYTAKDKGFQEYRRGRYAEFNLLYDRGTSFGLQSGGRIESILASLPPQTSWIYNKDISFIKNEKKLLLALQNKWRG